ncbi:MAG: DUF1801 domain-containing protein [Nitrospira sp.]
MKIVTPVPKTVDDYIAGFPPEIQRILRKIRTTIRRAAPGAEETISYRIPTFKLNGPIIYLAAFKTHIGLYPMTASVRTQFQKELSSYLSGKATARFPLTKPIPYRLIATLVRFKVREKERAMGSKKVAFLPK